jgi:phosphohistidine phosphatase
MATRLFLLRHAKASRKDSSLRDFDRPLTGRGRNDCAKIAEHMREHAIAPQLVLCSPAKRTRETLEGIRPALEHDPEVRYVDAIYDASPKELFRILRAVEDSFDSVMLIGHNPAEHELAVELAASGSRVDELAANFPTAALAELEFDGRIGELAPGSAKLLSLTTPKQVEAERSL